MAIVVGREKNKSGFFGILAWTVVLAIIVISAYYIFFVNPETTEFTVPGFKNTQEISQIGLNPRGVISTPEFQKLNQHISLYSSSNLGRANPFLPF